MDRTGHLAKSADVPSHKDPNKVPKNESKAWHKILSYFIPLFVILQAPDDYIAWEKSLRACYVCKLIKSEAQVDLVDVAYLHPCCCMAVSSSVTTCSSLNPGAKTAMPSWTSRVIEGGCANIRHQISQGMCSHITAVLFQLALVRTLLAYFPLTEWFPSWTLRRAGRRSGCIWVSYCSNTF